MFRARFAGEPFAFWLVQPDGSHLMGCADSPDDVIVGDARTPAYELLRERLAAGSGGASALGGWFGWLGYEFGAVSVGAPAAESAAGPPQVALMRCSAPLVVPAALDGHPALAARRAGSAPPKWRMDADEYRVAVDACLAAIRRGDAYQLCLTDSCDVAAAADPLEVFSALLSASPTATAGFVRAADHALASVSPEEFLRVAASGRVSTSPMKGTRPRGATAAEDDRLRAELAADAKERAENLMIVDLVRNDLSRVAALGTVEVTRLLEVETYPTAHQLVSTIEAWLRPGVTAVDAVAAAFPAGSMTGAPKLAAMTLLHELERGPRGVYAGCFGRFGFDGSARLSMAIRSVVLGPGGATVGAGGGVTALSDPGLEYAELLLKAALPLAVAGGAPESR